MSDLISREDALKNYQTICKGVACADCQMRYDDGECKLERFLRAAPTIEAEPRKRGRWIALDAVFLLIAGHSDYHGDDILSTFTCLAEGKEVNPVAPINVSKAEPVKHGRWILNMQGNWACSLCGNDPYHSNMHNMNYCPNCGAKMGEGREECVKRG